MKTLRFLMFLFFVLSYHASVLAEPYVQPKPLPYLLRNVPFNHVFAFGYVDAPRATSFFYCQSTKFEAAYNSNDRSIRIFCGGANENYTDSSLTVPAKYVFVNCFDDTRTCVTPSVSSIGDANASMGARPFAMPLHANVYSSVNIIDLRTRRVVMWANWPGVYEPFDFPLSPSTHRTPWTQPINAVFDHSMPRGPYTLDGIVLAFTSERGTVGRTCRDTTCQIVGYRKTDGGRFFENSTGQKIINYPGPTLGHNNTVLFADGSPGYSYPLPEGTGIYAPARGVLCVATQSTIRPRTPGALWRKFEQCPYSVVSSSTWEGRHAFYIVHRGLLINGFQEDYLTVILHSSALDSTIATLVNRNGFANVSRLQRIAASGRFGATGGLFSMRVYRLNPRRPVWPISWIPVDPYGGNGLDRGRTLWRTP